MHGKHKKMPWNTCIICHQKNCHSSQPLESGKQLYKQLVRANLKGGNDHHSDKEEIEANPADEEAHNNSDAGTYIVFTRAVAAMDMSPKHTKCLVEGALVDTGSNITSSVGPFLQPAVKIADMRDVKPDMNNNERRLDGIRKLVDTLSLMEFFFHIDGREYLVTLHIIPCSTPLLIPHKDLDDAGLNYRRYHKII